MICYHRERRKVRERKGRISDENHYWRPWSKKMGSILLREKNLQCNNQTKAVSSNRCTSTLLVFPFILLFPQDCYFDVKNFRLAWLCLPLCVVGVGALSAKGSFPYAYTSEPFVLLQEVHITFSHWLIFWVECSWGNIFLPKPDKRILSLNTCENSTWQINKKLSVLHLRIH